MNLVDKQDVALAEVCEDRCQIAGLFHGRPRRHLEISTHLMGKDVAEGGVVIVEAVRHKGVRSGHHKIKGFGIALFYVRHPIPIDERIEKLPQYVEFRFACIRIGKQR